MQYDYIVIGSGSAGCPLTARLVEKGASVLLIEAGRKERINLTHIPAALVKTIGNKRYDWKFETEPDPTRDGLVEAWPRGKVPGGSSAINGMIFIRGTANDFNAWESMGNTGWGWNDVLPYYRRMETADLDKDNAYRGGMGPLRVSALRWKHPISGSFIKSFEAVGVPYNPDLNGASHDGVSWNQGSTDRGHRHSTFQAFIKPKLGDPKLTFIDDTLVERVLFQGRRASGVAVRQSGQRKEYHARKGIVLAAGAINSPQLLMLSGIGDPVQLKKHGIMPFIDSPEVGRNLMEHPGLYVLAEMNAPTANSYARPLNGAKAFLEWVTKRSGFLSVPTAQVLAFTKSMPSLPESDLQFHLFPMGWFKKDGKFTVPNRNLVTILVNINHPRSMGHLELRSADPADPVRIYPRLLDHPDDLEGVRRGLGWVRKIASTGPFGSQVNRLLDVPDVAEGKPAEDAYLRRATVPFLHPVGTCRMGSDERSVLTPDLKVRGVDGLWVADTSIFPRHITGNTNATAIMIGEKASDLIHP